MPFSEGTRVGPYEVLGSLGAGGMGKVYRARDTKLDREVALKVLPDLFASDSDRLLRFEREARVLASLNHPHIAHIHGLETNGTTPVLALELVDGETLAERIARGPIPLDEALGVAKQIAQALEHAHEKSIVHRDLKPANIKVSPTGVVKVLDFGLARAMTSDGTASSISSPVNSPTITSPMQMTQAGIILGTAAYMAPEQARGKTVDQRADIWAFGCVVYEMLSARRAFPGDEMTDVLARVIEREPDWNLVPRTTPRSLTRLLQRCLRKDPAARLHSIADARLELDEVQQGAPEEPRDAAAVPQARGGWVRVLAGAAIGAALTAAVMLMLPRRAADAPPAQVFRYSIKTPEGLALARVDLVSSGRVNLAVSPDGEKLAAVLRDDKAQRKLWVKRFDEPSFREIPDTDGAQFVFWAPDSERIGFGQSGVVRETNTAGVNSRVMTTATATSTVYSWGPDDVILFSGPSTLQKFSASVGKPEPASQLASDESAHGIPVWLPNRKGFLYLAAFGGGRFALNHQPLAGPASRVSVFDSTGGNTLTLDYRSGHVLLTRAESGGRVNLTAQPLDLDTMQLTGQPMLLAADVNPSYSASDRILVLGPGGLLTETLDWVDETGKVVSNAAKPSAVFNFDLSPDERFIVLHLNSPRVLAVHDTARGVTSTLVNGGSDPNWSPDGRQIAYSAFAGPETGVYAIPAFGGDRRLILKFEPGAPVYTEDWSRDGRWIAAVRELEKEKQGILIPVDGKSEPVVIAREATNGVDELRFSPDGKWIAYGVTARSVPRDVFMVPNPATGERWQVSVNGGAQPRWRDDGKAIYYLSPSGTLMMVDVRVNQNGAPDISAPPCALRNGNCGERRRRSVRRRKPGKAVPPSAGQQSGARGRSPGDRQLAGAAEETMTTIRLSHSAASARPISRGRP
jgi:Tol biopolymer transport system component